MAKPTATPATAANDDSTAAITETWCGVAPTRRMAAKRSSRLAADSRLAVAIKMSIGTKRMTAAPARIHWRMGPLPLPLLLWQLKQLARVCWMPRTSTAPGTRDSWWAS